MAFKANTTESMGAGVEVTISQGPKNYKEKFICSCGASRFKWLSTEGTIVSGGFKADEYRYSCLGCGHEYTEKEVKAYFSHV
jgi:hypothetical protein